MDSMTPKCIAFTSGANKIEAPIGPTEHKSFLQAFAEQIKAWSSLGFYIEFNKTTSFYSSANLGQIF